MFIFVCKLPSVHTVEKIIIIVFSRPQMVANVSGCSLESTKEIADCMKNLDINTIETVGKVR